jgi:hypothetical protein
VPINLECAEDHKTLSTEEVIEVEAETNPIEAATDESEVAMNAIADANAEESEDESLIGRHEIPLQDYEAMPMEKLVEELEVLVAAEKVRSVREQVEEVKKAFLSKYHHFIEVKKDEFHAENTETTED